MNLTVFCFQKELKFQLSWPTDTNRLLEMHLILYELVKYGSFHQNKLLVWLQMEKNLVFLSNSHFH